MPIIFRKIRQKLLKENKFSKYLIYATGELALKSNIFTYYRISNNFNDLIWQYASDVRDFYNEILMSELVPRVYLDANSLLNKQEQCTYIEPLMDNEIKGFYDVYYTIEPEG